MLRTGMIQVVPVIIWGFKIGRGRKGGQKDAGGGGLHVLLPVLKREEEARSQGICRKAAGEALNTKKAKKQNVP